MLAEFVVSLRLPKGVRKQDMGEYIKDELKAGPGHRHPDDPLHDLDSASIQVRPLARRQTTTQEGVVINGVEWIMHLVNATPARLAAYKEAGIRTRRRRFTTLVHHMDVEHAREIDAGR